MKMLIVLGLALMCSMPYGAQSSVGSRFISKNYPTYSIGIQENNKVFIVSGEGERFTVVTPGLTGDAGSVSFESVDKPGHYIRHAGYVLWLHPNKDEALYRSDATFFPRPNKFYKGYTAYESVNYPNHFIRHQGYRLKISPDDGSELMHLDSSFAENTGPKMGSRFISKNYPAYSIGIQENNKVFIVSGEGERFTVVTPGLTGDAGSVSFESVDKPGHYIRHAGYVLWLHPYKDEALYRSDATFFPRTDKFYKGYTAYESENYPNHFIRHQGYRLKISPDDGSELMHLDSSFVKHADMNGCDGDNSCDVNADCKNQGASYTCVCKAGYEGTGQTCTRAQSSVGSRFISKNYPTYSIGIQENNKVFIVSGEGERFTVVTPGLTGDAGSVSFESVDKPGHYIRHAGYVLWLHPNKDEALYRSDATFFPRPNKFYKGYTAYESVNYPNHFIRHQGYRLKISPDDGSELMHLDSSFAENPGAKVGSRFISKNYPAYSIGIQENNKVFIVSGEGERFTVVTPGLTGDAGSVSFESVDKPGHYIRHAGYVLWLHPYKDEALYRSDATFFPRPGKFYKGYTAYESENYPNHFIRHQGYRLKISPDDGSELMHLDSSFAENPGAKVGSRFISKNYPAYSIGIQENNKVFIVSGEGERFTVVTPGLTGDAGSVSFESVDKPGHYIRHAGYVLWLHPYKDEALYRSDATFFPRPGKFYKGYTAYESENYPNHFIRHQGYRLKISPDDGSELMHLDSSFVKHADMNGCDGDNSCDVNADCENQGASYTCVCKAGYEGTGQTCTPICSMTCLNGGTCSAPETCECISRFEGTDCSTPICESCVNGECIAEPEGNTCSCTEGYQGESCAEDFDECVESPCSHECVNTEGSYHCECPVGLMLDDTQLNCEDHNECETDTHGCEQCSNIMGSYACVCDNGYELIAPDNKLCQDIDECTTGNNNCDQICENTSGSYNCACMEGYRLEPDGYKCVDVDECVEETDSCEHVCTNTEGSYTCSCSEGYQLLSNERNCEDIDECTGENDCQQICINIVGTYTCGCNEGFVIEEDLISCSDVNECIDNSTHDCHHVCTNSAGSFDCSCDTGFYLAADGKTCSDVDECMEETDSCEHVCTNTEGSYTCSCSEGYQLLSNERSCEDVNECNDTSTHDCHHVCANNAGSFACSCDTGFYLAADGKTCRELVNAWTTSMSGCQCYFDPTRNDCPCCIDGGCQCKQNEPRKCVQCGYGEDCKIPLIKDAAPCFFHAQQPESTLGFKAKCDARGRFEPMQCDETGSCWCVDRLGQTVEGSAVSGSEIPTCVNRNLVNGWTLKRTGCQCDFDPTRTDCACCVKGACSCRERNPHICTQCGVVDNCETIESRYPEELLDLLP